MYLIYGGRNPAAYSCPPSPSQHKRTSSSCPVPSNAASPTSIASAAQTYSGYRSPSFRQLWKRLLSAYSKSHKTPTLPPRWAFHTLVRQQLRLPLRERTSDLDAAGGYPHHAPPARNIEFSLTMTSLTSSYLPLSCTLPHGTHSRPSMSASTITAPVHRRGTVSNSYPQCLTAGIPMALTFY